MPEKQNIPQGSLERVLKEQYADKVSYIGSKSEEIRKIHAISANKKGSAVRSIVAEGIWLNRLALKHELRIEHLLCCPEEATSAEAAALIMELAKAAARIHIISAKTLAAVAESGNSAGIVSIVGFEKKSVADIPAGTPSLVLVLDGLEIPGNVGTLVRSVDGVDAAGVIITNKKTRLTHPKYIRSSQGSCFKIPVVEMETSDALKWLRDHHYRILLADTDADKLYYEEDYEGRVAIVLGSERYGISAPFYAEKHTTLGIPMFGDCDSLNVGIAGTVILYEAALKQKGRLNRR